MPRVLDYLIPDDSEEVDLPYPIRDRWGDPYSQPDPSSPLNMGNPSNIFVSSCKTDFALVRSAMTNRERWASVDNVLMVDSVGKGGNSNVIGMRL